MSSFQVNDRTYHLPAAPIAVICIDGCADEYITESIAQGYMPRLEAMVKKGYRGMVRGALPSFTNVNNSAIVTGAALAEQGKSDFLYLSLTDYMQHKYGPSAQESLDFHKQMDEQIGRLLDAGCIVAATADHGMNAKNDENGEPKVIFVETLLQEKFGKDGISVICPITDPYVVHHGALGSLVMVHLDDPTRAPELIDFLMRQDGITEVHDREMAALKLELAPDRIGDITVLSARDVVVGKTAAHHDLSVLKGGLRSHGGRYEEMVPILLSEPLNEEYTLIANGDPRNFDIFAFACNAGA